jgi:hypothetical protein
MDGCKGNKAEIIYGIFKLMRSGQTACPEKLPVLGCFFMRMDSEPNLGFASLAPLRFGLGAKDAAGDLRVVDGLEHTFFF